MSCDKLAHRGPDDKSEWLSKNGQVGLAHRRLSILDLSYSGRQPMHLIDRGLSIVYNGEIYNFAELRNELIGLGHIFSSNSDTEVLLHAYAEWHYGCLSKLNGMFAFAIYEKQKQELFLARDRAGEKPLYYFLNNEAIYFASELKALLINQELPRKLAFEALDCYLAMGYVPGDGCILAGYHKLPAAHALTFSLQSGQANIWRYWQLPELEVTPNSTTDSILVDELESLLEDSVRRQMIADVPVGILLSGGLDSSLVTAMAVRHSSNVRTFSIGFPGHGRLDETHHARLISQYFSTQHTELIAQSDIADLLPTLAIQFDEPMVDSSMFPTWLVCHLVRQHCTVALGGDGGDELFAGYSGYSRLLWMQRKLSLIPGCIRNVLAWTAEHALPVGLKGRNYLQAMNVDLRNGLPLLANYFDATQRRLLMRAFQDHPIVAETVRSKGISKHSDLLQRATRSDFEGYLVDDILVKVDRASMHNSLEVRAPLLDYRLIEFAFRKVPSHLKATDHDKKILLKKISISNSTI